MAAPPTERRLLFLLAAVQFVNVLDFVMVMPLGPDFARALGMDVSNLGVVAGSYTGAAAVSGIVGTLFLDRYDRKRALALSLAGLVIGTVAGGFATGEPSLIMARMLAGTFGGPATSMSLAIVADTIPPERRGRAMGTVFAAFSLASILGVPAGLELARLGGWRTPFFGVATLGLVAFAGVLVLMPPQRKHLEGPRPPAGALRRLVGRRPALLALLATATLTVSVFSVIPNLSAFFQFNAGYPRSRLGLLYLVGGVANFAAMAVAGRLTDRLRSSSVAAGGTALFVGTLAALFFGAAPVVPILLGTVTMMVSGALRMVPFQTISSRVPDPTERAGFLSVQSAVQHLSSSAGALASSAMLKQRPGGALVGMNRVAIVSVALSAAFVAIIWPLEASVRDRERLKSAAGPGA